MAAIFHPSHRTYVFALYREILIAARTYPSVKRVQVISDIKSEFRAHRVVPTQVELDDLLDKAEHTLTILRRYQALDKDASDWTIQL